MMDCADLDRDGKLDYMEFTHRFHSPAEQIGRGEEHGSITTNFLLVLDKMHYTFIHLTSNTLFLHCPTPAPPLLLPAPHLPLHCPSPAPPLPLPCPSPTPHLPLPLGFCLCVLITTLSDHLPGERRLECFRDSQSSIFKYFDKSLGRIEIVGESIVCV